MVNLDLFTQPANVHINRSATATIAQPQTAPVVAETICDAGNRSKSYSGLNRGMPSRTLHDSCGWQRLPSRGAPHGAARSRVLLRTIKVNRDGHAKQVDRACNSRSQRLTCHYPSGQRRQSPPPAADQDGQVALWGLRSFQLSGRSITSRAPDRQQAPPPGGRPSAAAPHNPLGEGCTQATHASSVRLPRQGYEPPSSLPVCCRRPSGARRLVEGFSHRATHILLSKGFGEQCHCTHFTHLLRRYCLAPPSGNDNRHRGIHRVGALHHHRS